MVLFFLNFIWGKGSHKHNQADSNKKDSEESVSSNKHNS